MSGAGSQWRRLWGGTDTAPTDELIRALEQLRPGPSPRPHFRTELRAQLVALAPTAVAEGVGPVAVPVHHRRTLVDSLGSVLAGVSPRRVLRGAVAVTAAFALVLGVAVWLSSRALPGDALYGLKRAREGVELNLTHGTAKGRKYLSLAHTRAEETSKLVSRANAMGDPVGDGPQADAVGGHVTHLIDSTMDAADKDLVNGWTILYTQATQQDSTSPIQFMIGWLPGQLDLLTDTADRLPDGAARNRLLASIQKAEAAKKLATAAVPTIGTGTRPTAPAGPSTRPGGTGPAPGPSGSRAPSGSNGQRSGGGTGGGTGATPPQGGGSPTGGGGAGGGGTSQGPPVIPPILPPITLPTVTVPGLPTISLPTISVPPITLGVRLPTLPEGFGV